VFVKHLVYTCVSCTGPFDDVYECTTNPRPKRSSCKEFLREPSIYSAVELNSQMIDIYSFPSRSSTTRHTSMHQVLCLDELVRNVSHCADTSPKGSASLLAFACCCKSLEGPVMDVLWHRQVDLRTILRTLPADSWTITDGAFVREKLSSLIIVNLTQTSVPVKGPLAG
jgi:hypothetical protein